MTDPYVYTGEEGSAEFSVLDSLVDEENMTPELAVQQIIDLAQTPQPYNNRFGVHCESTVSGIIRAAARTAPNQQTKLVAFIHELRRQTVIDPSTGQAYEYDGKVVWKDLPTFGYTVAYELASIPGKQLSTRVTKLSKWIHHLTTPEKMIKWENTAAFFAQLDASASDPEPDFSRTWALTYITLALVSPQDRYDQDLTVRLACMWFVYDAEKLWRNVPEEKGFSLTEWQMWKRNLEGKREEIEDVRTRRLVERAIGEMERVETI
jgi:hypothetical protein